MLLSEVKPINYPGQHLENYGNLPNVIDSIIELPLRETCKKFMRKSIRTVMSSANVNNILREGEERFEKKDLGKHENNQVPTYDLAGKGYAWIMLDYKSLSDKNKDLLFSLEKELGENSVWFVQPFETTSLQYLLETGQTSYKILKRQSSTKEIPSNVMLDLMQKRFYDKHVVLGYDSPMYPFQSVFLRMPVDSDTTVEDVEKYFENLVDRFMEQERKVELGIEH